MYLLMYFSLPLYYADESIFNVKAILALLSIPEVFYLITVKTLVGIPAGVFHSMFSVVNMERYSLTPEMNGYLLTFVGILTAVSTVSIVTNSIL